MSWLIILHFFILLRHLQKLYTHTHPRTHFHVSSMLAANFEPWKKSLITSNYHYQGWFMVTINARLSSTKWILSFIMQHNAPLCSRRHTCEGHSHHLRPRPEFLGMFFILRPFFGLLSFWKHLVCVSKGEPVVLTWFGKSFCPNADHGDLKWIESSVEGFGSTVIAHLFVC